MRENSDLEDFLVNYIGSKYSLMDFITGTVKDVTGYDRGEGLIFTDLFAGTGVVGTEFKRLGYHVIANDIQYYSYVLNKHYIENIPPLDSSVLSTLNTLDGADGFVSQNYCANQSSDRNYFLTANGQKCDAMRSWLEKAKTDGTISDDEYYWGLASLINSIDKYANTASVYGAYLKNIKKSAQKDLKLELLPVIAGERGEVYNRPAEELIKQIKGDILYLDPPYNTRQYGANYHVLETIARGDEPVLKGKTGMRDYTAQKSLFCSKKSVLAAFEQIIANANFNYIFLSYNNEGLMSANEIETVMSRYGKYSCRIRRYRRYKADRDENRQIAAAETEEYLHILDKIKL